jgi:hypothetical protein
MNAAQGIWSILIAAAAVAVPGALDLYYLLHSEAGFAGPLTAEPEDPIPPLWSSSFDCPSVA